MEIGVTNSYEEKAFREDVNQYRGTTIILLLFHIVFLITGLIFSLKYIVFINIFSISFYCLAFNIFKSSKKGMVIYAHSIIIEIMLHAFLCTLILGWGNGFQYWLFSLLCSYLFPYIVPDRSIVKNVKSAIIRTLFMFAEFAVLFIITHYYDFPFTNELSATANTILSITNAFVAFASIAAYAVSYTRQMEYKYSLLHSVADSDQLTGLGNRYFMNDLLMNIENKITETESYSVAMLDIDYFKKVNDSYGHDKGDMVLRGIASILAANSSHNINAGRWGGEEFLLVADTSVNFMEFVIILEKIRHEVLNKVFAFSDGEVSEPIKCTISIGAAKYEAGMSIQDVIKLADTNLYKAKENGRNQLVY